MQASHTAHVFHQAYQESARGTDVQAISLLMFLVIGYFIGRWRGVRAERKRFVAERYELAAMADRIHAFEEQRRRDNR